MFSNQSKWVQRLLIIALTMVVALIGRMIAVWLFDVDFISYDGEIGHEQIDVGIRPILVVPAIAGLMGWLVAEILERVGGARARLAWLVGAVIVYVVATLPLFPWDMPGKTKATLLVLHTLVAVVYIPLMGKTVIHRSRS